MGHGCPAHPIHAPQCLSAEKWPDERPDRLTRLVQRWRHRNEARLRNNGLPLCLFRGAFGEDRGQGKWAFRRHRRTSPMKRVADGVLVKARGEEQGVDEVLHATVCSPVRILIELYLVQTSKTRRSFSGSMIADDSSSSSGSPPKRHAGMASTAVGCEIRFWWPGRWRWKWTQFQVRLRKQSPRPVGSPGPECASTFVCCCYQ